MPSAYTHPPFTFTAGDKAVRQCVLQRIRLWISHFLGEGGGGGGYCLPADTKSEHYSLLFGPMGFKNGTRVRASPLPVWCPVSNCRSRFLIFLPPH